MKLSILMLASLFLNYSVPALAGTDYEGGFREFFITPNEYHFGSDHTAQIKREILEAGVGSITLHLRLAVKDSTSHAVYHPPYKTKAVYLDTIISRVLQADGKVVFKPGLYANPEMGSPSAITLMQSDNPQALFTSYGQTLQLYQAIAIQREISTFVVGMGMGQTFTAEFAPRWKALTLNLRSVLRPNTSLALELSHSSDLDRLEKWAQENPISFYDSLGSIAQVRFTLPLNEYVDPSTLVLNPGSMKKLLQNRYSRLLKLFPMQSIVLSNVMLPGCFGFQSDESEVECPTQKPLDPGPGYAGQTKLIHEFIENFKTFNQEMNNIISGLEIIVSNTDYEPAYGKSDARFPYFNKDAFNAIKTELLPEKPKDVSLPFKSLKSAYLPRAPGDAIDQKTACIYFDEADENDNVGAIHARLLENVIGAFKDWRRERRSIILYESGDLKSCHAVFYLASNFTLKAPAAFYPELATFVKTNILVWFNYKIDQFHQFYTDNKIPNPIAFDTPQVFQPTSLPSKLVPDPGFYRYFDYKGETFFKQAKFDQMTGRFMSSPELNQIRILKPEAVEVKATARHSKDNSVVPYVIKQKIEKGALWYFADLPFSFIHYEDRYLIFCDQLWDILEETAPTTQPMALVRIEDVNASDMPGDLNWVVDYLNSENVPFSLAVIPFYSNLFRDPFNDDQDNAASWQPAYQNKKFSGFLNYAKALKANFVMHGVAHQSGDLISGYHGISGADYEFWLYPDNVPMPKDSSDWFTHKIQTGEDVLTTLGIRPTAWETPHYASSVLDSYILSKTFAWNYQRNIYFKSELIQDVTLDTSEQFFNCTSIECRNGRTQKLEGLKVIADYRTSGAQFLPFITYKDSYGQSLIPETLGMIDFAMYPPDTWRPMGYPEDVIRRAKKLRVIRGAVASFFWHPSLIEPDHIYYKIVPGSFDAIGGKQTLTKIITALKEMGYQFVSTSDCNIFPQQSCKKQKESL